MTLMLRLTGAVIALLAAAPVARAADPVVIGLEIPLSPPGDPTAGQLIRRGGEFAIEYINGPWAVCSATARPSSPCRTARDAPKAASPPIAG